jgi:serine/threonine-protein kinase
LIASAELKPQLEKYELVEEIGHGGMATVYRARDKRLDRDVAVKIIHRHLRENPEVTKRFAGEARAVAKVKHPNIVEVYDVSDEREEERYLVVELVRGTTLRKLLQVNGNIPAEVAAALTIEIASGLDHAHKQGVIHRDIKPENVLVELPSTTRVKRESLETTSDARVARIKITDFGIAKLLDVQGVTSTGQVLGSPAHMAPEQIEGGDVTIRSDVFGLGVLLYECVVGKLPFDGKNPAQVLRKVLDGKFTPADRARPTVGADFSRIVDKALAHDQNERYESVEQFGLALKAELDRLGFDDPRRELAEYLVDPASYSKAYEERVVARLVERGRAARKARDVQRAAAEFNRALAFRPDNVELLRQVSGLARAQRLRRALTRAGAVAAACIGVGSIAYAVTRELKERQVDPVAPNAKTTTPRVSPPIQAERATVPTAAPSGRTRAYEKVRAGDRRRGVAEAPRRVEAEQTGKATRDVKIQVNPADTIVKIDGVRQANVFGLTFPLTVGTHEFEFVPGNEKCCEGPVVKQVQIVAGSDVYFVRGDLKLKPAKLSFRAQEGTRLLCGRLGEYAPGERDVSVSLPTPVKCTVHPAPGSGLDPKDVDVTLRPGETSTVVWP